MTVIWTTLAESRLAISATLIGVCWLVNVAGDVAGVVTVLVTTCVDDFELPPTAA